MNCVCSCPAHPDDECPCGCTIFEADSGGLISPTHTGSGTRNRSTQADYDGKYYSGTGWSLT